MFESNSGGAQRSGGVASRSSREERREQRDWLIVWFVDVAMGNQKQKWTAEEEDALNRGVQKYGAGKWKNILKDPDFAPFLITRSNIDLKVLNPQISSSRFRVRVRVLASILWIIVNFSGQMAKFECQQWSRRP